jgi:hypothetical protein
MLIITIHIIINDVWSSFNGDWLVVVIGLTHKYVGISLLLPFKSELLKSWLIAFYYYLAIRNIILNKFDSWETKGVGCINTRKCKVVKLIENKRRNTS